MAQEAAKTEAKEIINPLAAPAKSDLKSSNSVVSAGKKSQVSNSKVNPLVPE